MLTDKYEIILTILTDGQIQVRRDRIILDNDVEVNRLHHRYVLEPGQVVPDEVANTFKRNFNGTINWNPSTVEEFKRKKDEALSNINRS